MADYVAVPLDEPRPFDAVRSDGEGGPGEDGVGMLLVEASESDLVGLRTGVADVQDLADDASGRLTAIALAAQQVHQSLRERLDPDEISMEISVGLSGQVGWFVAKSSASGGIKLTLTWSHPRTAR